MKIGLLSDIHLGKRLYRKSIGGINYAEKEHAAKWILAIEDMIKTKPDLLLIAGDLFDKPNPTTHSLKEANDGMELLHKAGIETIVIGGNHDFNNSNDRLGIHPFQNLKEFEKIHYVYEGVEFFEYEDLLISALPHQRLEIDEEKMELKDSKIKEAWIKINKKNRFSNKKKLFLTHGTIESLAYLYSHSATDREYVNTYNMVIPDKLTEMFDFLIIGHIHNPFKAKVKSNTSVTKRTLRVHPGSLINPKYEDQGNFHSTGPLYLDTETVTLSRTVIPSIKVIKKRVYGIKELIELLENVEDNFYSIEFKGEVKDIPSEIYSEAVKKALFINIKLISEELEEKEKPTEVETFWGWVEQNYPDLKEEFKEVLEKES